MKKFLCGVLVCLLSGNLLAKDAIVGNISAVKSNTISKSAASTVSNVSNSSKARMAIREISNEKFVVQDGKMITLRQINYQGWIGNKADTTGITDTLAMSFRIYDAVTSGTLLWSETNPAVEVSKGVFNVLLGSVTPLVLTMFTGAPLWLETQIVNDTLTPRKKMVTVGTAVYADKANYADYAGTAFGDTLWKDAGIYVYPAKANNFTIWEDSPSNTGLSYVGGTNTDAITNWNNDNTQSLINYHSGADRYAALFRTFGDSAGADYGIYARSDGEYAGFFEGNIRTTGDAVVGGGAAITGNLTANNMPGVASTRGNRTINLVTADSTCDSIIVNAPANGYVVLTLDVWVNFTHTNGAADIPRISISKTKSLDFANNLAGTTKAANDETASDCPQSISITRTEAISAGANKYYFVANVYSGVARVGRWQFTAMYFPTSCGNVTKSVKNDKPFDNSTNSGTK
jgi:hypothetical protein